MSWEPLPTDYTDAVWSGLKRYSQVDNEDGTVSFQDVTVYTGKEKSFFGASDANSMNTAINTIMNKLDGGELIDKKQNQWLATTSGSGSAYTATLDPAPASLTTGMIITIIPHTNSTSTSATLNVNGLGAKSFRQRGYTTGTLYSPYTSSFLSQGKPVQLIYDGTYWVIVGYSKPYWNDIQSKPSSFTPTSHASTATTYGVGSASNYGHVKVIDNLTQSSNLSGTALSAYQGKVLKDTLDEKPGKTLAGESVYPESGSAVTAEPGAEIFNDYRARGSGDFLGGNATQGNVASGYWAHAEGGITTASGDAAHAEGSMTTALGNSSHAEGSVSRAVGDYSHAAGRYTIANLCQTVVGKFNLEKAGPDSDNSSTGGSLFIVGSGTGNTQRSNAFRVENGTTGVYGAGSYHSTGADYAEHFEWLDGNPDREDRRGLFVTLDGEKIRLAAAQDDYILGVISATPTVVGDSREDEWQGKYLKDVFGELLTETVTIPEEKDEKTGKVITPEHQAEQYILNPEYNAGENYIGREQRAEWAIVGLMGKMVAVDDGNCEVNGYCMPGSGGIAVPADKGYRVMKRLDSTHIQILFK